LRPLYSGGELPFGEGDQSLSKDLSGDVVGVSLRNLRELEIGVMNSCGRSDDIAFASIILFRTNL